MANFGLGKVPPNNLEAERALLGALLLDSKAISETKALRIEEGDFYSPQHQAIFEAMSQMEAENEPCDIQTLSARLAANGKLAQAGGAANIASLTDEVPSSANAAQYAKIVLEASMRRKILSATNLASANAFEESKDLKQTLDEIQAQFFELSKRQSDVAREIALSEVFLDIVEVLERKETQQGISTGFPDLDLVTNGFQKAEVTLIGARPSIGKTAFALNMACNAAIQKKVPTAFFSLEMSVRQLGYRILSAETRIESQKLMKNLLSSQERATIVNRLEDIMDAPLYFVETPNMSMMDLRTHARRLATEKGVQILFIDYLGLIRLDKSRGSLFEDMTQISRLVKSLARELDIPIVALAQLNRDAENVRPMLSNLRDSGSLEQDADVVMFLHRDRENKDEASEFIDTQIIVEKNRNGPIGTVNLGFFNKIARFDSIERQK